MKQDIINWLKDYSKKNNDLCFIVGVSGGIDSATVSTLCAETGIPTHVCSLPIKQNQNQLILAQKHIEWLKSKYSNVISHDIDLSLIFDSIKLGLSNYDKDLAWANTKSRIRMVTLYQIASFYNGLVVGTGNKVEDFGVGFFTKYGDGGVDISPIGDLNKTEVRNMAKEMEILQDIIDARPTDGLWDDDRTDEDQIGASYEELEWAMELLSDKTEREIEVLFKYLDFNRKNKHKMISIPVYKKKNNKINLFQEFFVEYNPERLNEYTFCLNKNLNNSHIDNLYLNINKEEWDNNQSYFDEVLKNRLVQNGKLKVIINDEKRFTFNKLIKMSSKMLPENSVVVVANLDIFIPETDDWGNIYEEFFNATNKKVCLALARTEYVNEETQFEDDYAWNVGEFADCWSFVTPLQIKENDFPYDIPVGFAPTCDNHMFILLSKTYDYVFNWAEKYRIYHYDIVRKPDVIENKRGRMIINDNTYKLPDDYLKQNKEVRDLSPRKNWLEIFNKIKI